MSILYPDIETIKKFKVKPEKGELHLLEFLLNSFDDTFEVYFQPFLNGDRPDIIIMRKNQGVLIVEVKDYNLDNYFLDERKKFRLKQNNSILKSPIDQVIQYKENIYNLHVEKLLERKTRNFKFWKVVNCALYFHCETQDSIDKFFIEPFKNDDKYLKFIRYNIDLIGNNKVNEKGFTDLFKKLYILSDVPSFLFSDDLYESFKRYLKPPTHIKNEGEYTFDKLRPNQKKAIESKPEQRIVKGVVGSGKTTVLAARAINAYKRTNERILILCYNITLKNYIHDKISKFKEDFDWNCFYINNYHNFLTSEMNNCGIEFDIPSNFSELTQNEKSVFFEKQYYSNINLFNEHKNTLPKYKTILIDEIQDYKPEWMKVIKDCFLEKVDSEYVLFGDEKQNIYANEIELKEIKVNIVNPHKTTLKESFRLENVKLVDIAIGFQKLNFDGKYNIDEFEKQQTINYGNITYTYLEKNINIPNLYEIIKNTIIECKDHPNDIAVLGIQISILRELDCYYRYKTSEKTNAMFETQEVWYKLFFETFKKFEVIQNGLSFFPFLKDLDDKKNALSVLIAIKDLVFETNDSVFINKFNSLISKHKINVENFNNWYFSEHLNDLLNRDKKYSLRKLESIYPAYRKLTNKLKEIRDNKKIHFWYERGTLKLSTIHSFKGWEAHTLFLILEEKFDNSDFPFAFEELIYVGLTRSKSNLYVINYGNEKHHKIMNELINK